MKSTTEHDYTKKFVNTLDMDLFYMMVVNGVDAGFRCLKSLFKRINKQIMQRRFKVNAQ